MPFHRLRRCRELIGVALVSALVSSCATSSSQFVGRAKGYARHVGQITSIEGVSSDKLEELADGVAITLSAPARVTLVFDERESRSKVFELESGDIIVCGEGADSILEPYDQEPAAPDAVPIEATPSPGPVTAGAPAPGETPPAR